MNKALAILLLACGCSNDSTNSGTDAPVGSQEITYSAFTARTRTVADADSYMQMAVTDGTGPIACGLSTDHHNSLGAAGHEIIMALQSANGYPCPTGTFSVPSNCPADLGFTKNVLAPCAYYRAWDASGTDLGSLRATAGTVNVSGDENSCNFQVTFSFSGTQFTDQFTLTNLLSPEPWCK